MDSATEFLFGSCVHSLHGILPYPFNAPQHLRNIPQSDADKFAEAFKEAQIAISHRTRLIWLWPWFELFKSKTGKHMRRVDAYLAPILEKALRSESDEKSSANAEKSGNINEEATLLGYLSKQTKGWFLQMSLFCCSFSF